MREGTIHILDLDFEFKLWKNRLIHFQTELEIIHGQIFVLNKEHPAFGISEDKLKELVYQQNFIRKSQNKIETMEQEMALYAQDYPINENHAHYLLHEEIRKEIERLMLKQNKILTDIYPVLCYPRTVNNDN
jgi:hypothetical protein